MIVSRWTLFTTLRYILTQYLVVIWAANGVRSKIVDKEEGQDIPEDVENFVLAILIIAVITFLVRIGIVIYRVIKKPLTKMTTVSNLSTK